ncbi:MAG: hypothetical protein K0S29_897 [Gammaproteobacteria bacterium]|jgi:hypothetical protein|nr:hypothetical protein [Gammaproteobacteria bacterium]
MRINKLVTNFINARAQMKSSAVLCDKALALKEQGKIEEAHVLYKRANEIDQNSKAAKAGMVITERNLTSKAKQDDSQSFSH